MEQVEAITLGMLAEIIYHIFQFDMRSYEILYDW
jgi:hypothetical protein